MEHEKQRNRHGHDWVKHAGNQDKRSCQHASPIEKPSDCGEGKNLGRKASG